MDRQTFDRLMLDHLPAAQRFAVRLTNDPAAAEDLVHDALVRAAQSWTSFRGASSFQTWFFRIVINAFRDGLRRKLPEQEELPDSDALAANATIDPLRRASDEELGRHVADLVSALPPRQREVLVLVAYEGLAPSEAAGVLGISEQNARTTLHLARRKLKQQLQPYLEEQQREPDTRSIPSE